MSVGVSPDGRTLAIDMQGSIWTLPSSGGSATAHARSLQRRAPTDMVARRQDDRILRVPRRRLRRLGVAPTDESTQADLGNVDDREPIWSHDGTRIAFSSDRGDALGSDYNIWTLDTRSGDLRQVTKNSRTNTCRRGRPTTRRLR